MEIHRQQCQACGGYDMRDILVREEAHPTVIYVRCCNCASLVARYELSDYYHHGKGIESYLRSHASTSSESGRDVLDAFAATQERAVAGYERAIQELVALGKLVDQPGSVDPEDAAGEDDTDG